MNAMQRRMLFCLLTATACPLTAHADVTPNALFSDGAVLQRNQPIPVFGSARDGEAVTVSLNGRTAKTTASNGRFLVTLPPMKAGGPFILTISGDKSVTVKDILIGEVFVCSGQSNMEFSLAGAANAASVVPASTDPELRMFTVQKATSPTPIDDISGSWRASNPKNSPSFSAVAYFFGRDLRSALRVPIGLIHTSWGGTRAEAWTSRPSLLALNSSGGHFDVDAPNNPNQAVRQAEYEKKLAAWRAAGSHQGAATDAGNAGASKGWAKTDFDDSNWQEMTLPGAWETRGGEWTDLDGVVWFRKDITVSDADAAKNLTLALGAIDDGDTTYINGVQVGETKAADGSWLAPRTYSVPSNLIKPGKNVIAVRVFDQQGGGGMTGPAIALKSGDTTIASLDGAWKCAVEQRVVTYPPPPGSDNPNAPSVLYNAMIAPLIPYGIKGAIWYQGESNAGNPTAYATLFPAMITDWRKNWGEGNFPFYFVQLAPFGKIVQTPQESGWGGLREAQRLTLQKLPNTGMSVITDVGEENDIHPKRKEPVGHRLALAALADAYGKKIEGSGPTFDTLTIDGANAVLHFKHLGGGLRAEPAGPLTGFAVKGGDGKWVNADARIDGNMVVVSAPSVSAPVAVRFGWADFPVVNLSSKAGIPASPFTTEKFGE